ncbi:MAG: sulfatase-like hydrolase/transferase [Gammaproteobacteria bacterium]|jgi:arylsulfatase A-like enzyme|nr:sulfatase-like hydrolase/transferase [Gammaproteobacteria bacterium]MBT5603731.1 sulfatase-like hydrolase/transferase [Gammaproteobacteria bacterium]MBT6244690.1 sulfatase-like hydrolase/transferase [Gammaproteobacteria bacterium]
MKRPNILLFITDQHRADHLGCYGNQQVKTPNIDALASSGTRYEHFYVANPVCMANRASLMTGRMPSSHGVYSNGTPLSENSMTFVHRLLEEGYHTALIGKSHLQTISGIEAAWQPDPKRYQYDENGHAVEAESPNRRGEQYLNEDPRSWAAAEFRTKTPYYGFEHVTMVTGHGDETSGDYEQWLKEQPGDWNRLRGQENAITDAQIVTPQAWRTQLPEELYPTAYIAERTTDYLNAHAAADDDQPFFIQCSFPDPHHPFTPPGKYWQMYDANEITLPSAFGRGDTRLENYLHQALEEGTAKRGSQMPFAVNEREVREAIALTYGMITMIDDRIGRIMAELKRLGMTEDTLVIFTSDHGDYMGDRGLMLKGPLHLNGLLRVPFIWLDPMTKGGVVSRELGQTIDIPTTIMDYAGILPYYGIQGRVLAKDPEAEALLIEDSRQRVNLGFNRFQGLRTLITRTHRLTIGMPDAGNELYDLTVDPDERHNLWLAPAHQQTRTDLLDALVRKMISMQDPVPLAPYYA